MNQIEISGPDSAKESIPPEAKNFYARAKAVAVVITALTALITAVTALVKTMDTSLQKASYEELSKSISNLSEANLKTNEDIKALHEYLKKDREVRKEAMAAASAEPTTEPPAGTPHPAPPAVGNKLKPKPKPVITAPVPPPLPSMNPQTAVVIPPDFKAVEDKAKK